MNECIDPYYGRHYPLIQQQWIADIIFELIGCYNGYWGIKDQGIHHKLTLWYKHPLCMPFFLYIYISTYPVIAIVRIKGICQECCMYARIHHRTDFFGSRSRSRTGCTWRSKGKRKHQGIVDGNMTCADAVGGSTCPRGCGEGVRAGKSRAEQSGALPSKWRRVHGHIDRLEWT
jgi:hypothetical protein